MPNHPDHPTPPNHPSLPTSLDFADWLAWGLTQKDEITLCLALVELRWNGVQKSFEPRLAELSRISPLPAVRELAASAMLHQKALHHLTAMNVFNLSPEDAAAAFAQPGLEWSAILPPALRRPSIPRILDLWRKKLSEGCSETVTALGLALLARFGDPDDLPLALPHLQATRPEVLNGAMDLLARQAPEKFADRVEGFLANPDPAVRFNALHHLRTVDEQEARLAVTDLLFHSDPFLRQRAARELLLYSFPEMAPYFWRFLGLETHPLLLVAPSLAFAINPHPDLPDRLYKLIEHATGVKRHLLESLLKAVHESIRLAGF